MGWCNLVMVMVMVVVMVMVMVIMMGSLMPKVSLLLLPLDIPCKHQHVSLNN